MCNGMRATPGNPAARGLPRFAVQFRALSASPRPAPATTTSNPPRIAPRNLFDVSLGKDNLFHARSLQGDLDLTAVNVDQQVRALQLPVDVQRHALRNPTALTAR